MARQIIWWLKFSLDLLPAGSSAEVGFEFQKVKKSTKKSSTIAQEKSIKKWLQFSSLEQPAHPLITCLLWDLDIPKLFSFSRFFLEKSSNKEVEGNKFSQNSIFYSWGQYFYSCRQLSTNIQIEFFSFRYKSSKAPGKKNLNKCKSFLHIFKSEASKHFGKGWCWPCKSRLPFFISCSIWWNLFAAIFICFHQAGWK